MRRVLLTQFLGLVCLLGALPVIAAEGRIPVYQPITIGPGQEGMYILTRDITAPAGSAAIDILANTAAVDIDLNGFTIYGQPGGNLIQASRIDSLTVRNGTLMRGGGDGIYAEDCNRVVVEDVKVHDVAGSGIAVLAVDNFALRRNIVYHSQSGDGILIDGFWSGSTIPSQGTIEDNLVEECPGGIRVLNGESVAIRNNRVEDATVSEGIYAETCRACLITENTVQGATSHGIDLHDFFRGKIYNNVVEGTHDLMGIRLDLASDDNLILNNVSSYNGMHGMEIASDGNHVEGNLLNSNGTGGMTSYGLHFVGANNTYRGNTAQGNPGPAAVCAGFPATTDICDEGPNNVSPFNQPPNLAGDNLMPGLL